MSDIYIRIEIDAAAAAVAVLHSTKKWVTAKMQISFLYFVCNRIRFSFSLLHSNIRLFWSVAGSDPIANIIHTMHTKRSSIQMTKICKIGCKRQSHIVDALLFYANCNHTDTMSKIPNTFYTYLIICELGYFTSACNNKCQSESLSLSLSVVAILQTI